MRERYINPPNLSNLLDRPQALQDRVFGRLFEQAEIARYTDKERHDYEESVKNYRDYINTVDTAFDKGKAEGRAEANRDIAIRLKEMGMSWEDIEKATGLTQADI